MKFQASILRILKSPSLAVFRPISRPTLQLRACPSCGQSWLPRRRYAHTPADDPSYESIVDNPPLLVKQNQKHGPGLILLVAIPAIAFGLGTWQIFRLKWKTELIARFEDRILRPPLPLPPRVDPDAIKDFDYRRVDATGVFRHDQEMLIGPRVHDGKDGFLVVTPLQREDGCTILVNRGWIPKKLKRQADRKAGLPMGPVTVEGLLREPWKKNMFTPNNKPELGEFYFPDVEQMAKFIGSDPIWVEETMQPDLIKAYDREAAGIPIGRPAAVNLRNNHTQYIFTW
ncbi:hypothetical protein N7G274_009387 [Stereocaulon virgatum]|uniref:SURF1-like protein n=1 Tax=Stereocaulon virgatum TaxID=373712 RepID=A0ABR3ZWB6_9LECA